VRLQDLLGRRVRDVDGRLLGRVEEVFARREGQALVVHEYHVGGYALLERLAGGRVRRALLAVVPFTRPTLYRVPWHALDITDPKRPRLRCSVDDLERRRRRPAA
jgi:ribosomal 30S subunit maturation factor RimM